MLIMRWKYWFDYMEQSLVQRNERKISRKNTKISLCFLCETICTCNRFRWTNPNNNGDDHDDQQTKKKENRKKEKKFLSPSSSSPSQRLFLCNKFMWKDRNVYRWLIDERSCARARAHDTRRKWNYAIDLFLYDWSVWDDRPFLSFSFIHFLVSKRKLCAYRTPRK